MTSLIDLFKEALVYPTKDYKALVIFGVIFLIANLSSVLIAWNIEINGSVISLLAIVSLILYFVTEGYILSVLKETINHGDEIPALNILENFIDGLKLLVVQIVYYMAISAVPQDLWAPLFTGLAITGIVAIILYIIFGLLLEIAMCRLAKYGDIGEAINFKEVIADIQAIGIGRFIAWFIILFICALVLGFVLGIITAIPFIGILIAFLVGAPFIALFGARSLGNLYADEE